MQRIAPFLALAALAVVTRPADATVLRRAPNIVTYLYVGTNVVSRYRVIDGVPAQRPDLTYAGVTGPLAVDSMGDLYAAARDVYITVNVYPRGSNTPLRSYMVDLGGFPTNIGITGLGVDASGRSYLAFFSSSSDAQPLSNGHPVPNCTAYCVLAYGARAHGFPRPLSVISDSVAFVDSLALGPTGTLYGDQFIQGFSCPTQPNITVIADPSTKPKVLGSMSGPYLNSPYGLAADSLGKLYVVTGACLSPRPPRVDVFAATALGQVRPERQIFAPKGSAWGGPLAVDDHYVYVAGKPGVIVYDKLAHGTAVPVGTLTLPSNQQANFIAVGT
jgi:hypothetical protein